MTAGVRYYTYLFFVTQCIIIFHAQTCYCGLNRFQTFPPGQENWGLLFIRHYQIYRNNYVLPFRVPNRIVKINCYIGIPDEISA